MWKIRGVFPVDFAEIYNISMINGTNNLVDRKLGLVSAVAIRLFAVL